MGYWDRHGFDNLIEGDSTYFSDDVKTAAASREHFANYYDPKEARQFGVDTIPDASDGNVGGEPAHRDVHADRFDRCA